MHRKYYGQRTHLRDRVLRKHNDNSFSAHAAILFQTSPLSAVCPLLTQWLGIQRHRREMHRQWRFSLKRTIIQTVQKLTLSHQLNQCSAYNPRTYYTLAPNYVLAIYKLPTFVHLLLFIHKILISSTCFEPQVLIFRRIQLYTCCIWYCHSLW